MINLLDQNVINTILADLNGSEDRNRKRNSFDSWQIYSGNQAPYIERELQRTRPKSWSSYTISNVSLSKLITDKKSKAYNKQPRRVVSSDDIKSEFLHEIYSEGDAFRQLQFMDCVTNLHKYSLVWVNYRDEEEQFQFMTLQGHEFSIIRNKDTGRLECVILNYGNLDITAGAKSGDGYDNLLAESQADGSANSQVYAMWTKEQHVVIKVEESKVNQINGVKIKRSITYVPIDGNPSNENKLGVIPFVFISKELSQEMPTPSPLASQSVTYNALFSELLTSANIQGTGTLVLSYPEKYEGKFKDVATGLTTTIRLPQSSIPNDSPTKVEYISPSPALSEQKDAYLAYLRQVLSEHGITTSQGLDGANETFSSGLERMIANADVMSQVEQNQELYIRVEQEIFEIIKAWDVLLGFGYFKEDDILSIHFPKPKLMVSDSEILANIEKRLQMGLIQKYEALMIVDPNLSEDQAKEKLLLIDAEKRQNLSRMINVSTERDIQDDQA
jgi:hypothetical protein